LPHDPRRVEALNLTTGPLVARTASAERRADLARLLCERLGRAVDVRACASHAEAEAGLGPGGDVAAAWLPPVLTVRTCDAGRGRLLVGAVRAPGAFFHGTLFVRADAAYERVEDLRGSRVAWVDRESCSGYLFPRMALVLRGLDPDGLFASQRELGSHRAVARAVAEGEADVGATFLNMDASREDSGAISAGWYEATETPMRPLLTTDPIPSDAFVARADLPAEVGDALRAALTSLHEDPVGARALRELFSVRRFEPVDPRAYAPVRAALRT
jgi:phosphonate transport system substrate-binding protein